KRSTDRTGGGGSPPPAPAGGRSAGGGGGRGGGGGAVGWAESSRPTARFVSLRGAAPAGQSLNLVVGLEDSAHPPAIAACGREELTLASAWPDSQRRRGGGRRLGALFPSSFRRGASLGC